MRERLERLDDLQARLSRNHRRREIPWEAFDRDAHRPSALERVGRAWAYRAKQEHLAVGAFAHVTAELAEEGCDPVVLGLIARAASDEVRHTALCAEWARRLLDDPEVIAPRLSGMPKLPRHESATPHERVLFHVVEMCCFSETLTGVYLTEMRDRATDPTAMALIECLLEDEIDHGRVGWAYLEQRRRDGSLCESLLQVLPAMADRTVGAVVRHAAAKPEPRDPAAEALGHIGLDDAAQLHQRTLAELIAPGLEAVGVDTSGLG